MLLAARVKAIVLVVLALCAVGACKDAAPRWPDDRAWGEDDFARVAARSDCRVPAFGSRAFDRMLDPHVIETIAPMAQASMTRLERLLDYQDALRTIMKRYYACGDVRGMLATSTAFVELMVVMLPLADELMAGIAPDDPTRQARADGLAQMRQGIVALVTGTATTVRGTAFAADVPGVGRRLGTALARLERLMPADVLAGPIATVDVPEDDDDDPHRRALRADIRAGLREGRAAAPLDAH